jgi:hypothetical protein
MSKGIQVEKMKKGFESMEPLSDLVGVDPD